MRDGSELGPSEHCLSVVNNVCSQQTLQSQALGEQDWYHLLSCNCCPGQD